MGDPVTSPDHYRWIPGIECKNVVAYFDKFRGDAIQYIWRSGHKEGESEARALRKAIESLKVRLAFIEGADYDELRDLEERMP